MLYVTWTENRDGSHFLSGLAEMTKIDQQQRIDAYIRGKLDPQSAADFEEVYLQDAELLAELELTYALKQGLFQEEYQPEIDVELAWWQKLGTGLLQPARAIVATSAIVVSTLAFTVLYQSRTDLLTDQQALATLQPDVSIVTFSRLRSARENTDFSAIITPGQLTSGLAILEFEIDWPPQPAYQVTIAAHGDNQLEPIAVSVKPDDRGYLVMVVPANQLPAGDYQILISAANNSEVPEQEFSLRVNPTS